MTEATKRPWSVGQFKWDVVDEMDNEIAQCSAYENRPCKANAALIVRAANAHEALLAACKESLEYLDGDDMTLEERDKLCKQLEAAIALGEK